MKELSIKERACRYDEALERAKEKYAMFEGMKQGDVLEDIFPELKKSEDEQIRKALIQNLKERFGTKGTMGGILDMPKVLSWLEKQGESDETRAKMFLIDKGYPIDTNGIFPTYEEMYNIIREGLEKQGEQKSIDDLTPQEAMDIAVAKCFEQGEQKPYGQREECSDCQFNYAGECKGYCAIKRGEQKP